jgi:hypothetical protein
MPVAERLENHATIKHCQSSVAGLHLQVQLSAASTSDVKRLVAIFVAALYASTHLLVADVARQLPSGFGNLLNVHDGFHERVVTKRHLRYPHCAKQVSPFGGIGLLECTIRVGAKDARL